MQSSINTLSPSSTTYHPPTGPRRSGNAGVGEVNERRETAKEEGGRGAKEEVERREEEVKEMIKM